ncbi:peptide-methionine (S)-S-oxide reductase MsrA [Candidatus Saccharibacteria bacterium]|nr:peptide-methionine (S)-S-oxide reductase MsrA [Candidatus Saccharibacteria bacterium]
MSSKATIAGGCFWCIEAIYQLVKGVDKVVSGYSGGHTANPTYEQLHKDDTGHAEAVQIDFDDSVISYEEILQIFYYVHDPTTPNRQGNNVGAEYRSVIFYHDDNQKKIAEDVTNNFARSLWNDPIVTEIIPLDKFWPAEDYHQNYFKNNPNQAYCQLIINPKLEKFRSKFEGYLK